MKYLMLYETVPAGLALAPPHFAAHRARLAAFHAQGTLLMAGPLMNPTDGAIGLFTTREAAEEFMREDPFLLNGVVQKATLREWAEAFAP
jgi:uncharacterized protein YciI